VPNTIIGAIAVAVASASMTLLALHAEHDFARSVSTVGLVYAIASFHYLAVDRRMTRVERLQIRSVSVDHDILTTLRNDRDGAARFN
jgi:NO-binding membrane sensor protein with MHYT domain